MLVDMRMAVLVVGDGYYLLATPGSGGAALAPPLGVLGQETRDATDILDKRQDLTSPG